MNSANKAKADALITEDRRTTLDGLAENLGVSHGSAYNIVESLSFSKVCALWVPRELTTERKTDRVYAFTELLEQLRFSAFRLSSLRLLKEGFRGKHYASDEEVKTAVKKLLKEQSTEFYEAGIHALIQGWKIAIERNGDYVEK